MKQQDSSRQGMTIYQLEREWRDWITERPRNPDAAFVGFCRKWYERRDSIVAVDNRMLGNIYLNEIFYLMARVKRLFITIFELHFKTLKGSFLKDLETKVK